MLTLKEIEKGCPGLTTNQNLVWVNAKCEECGGQLQLDTSVVLTTYPCQYRYVCSDCGNVESSFVKLPQYKQLPKVTLDWTRDWARDSEITSTNYKENPNVKITSNPPTYWKDNSSTTLRGNVISIVGNSQEQVIPITSI